MNYGIDETITSFDTIKDVNQIIMSPYINYKRIYNQDNILIIDDDLKKVSMNKNFYIVKNDIDINDFLLSIENIFNQS